MDSSSSRTIDFVQGLTGKVAFVTGGVGGIGQSCVRTLIAHGMTVAFSHTEGDSGEEAARSLCSESPDFLSAHVLDLRCVRSIRTCMSGVLERWGRMDVLVNCAGVGSATVSEYATEPAEQDSAMLAINADGTLKACTTFLDLMDAAVTREPLKIINISSVGGGIQTFPGFRLSDGMSKAAVAALTKQLAAELIHSKVDVFALCPGATDTPMFQASTLESMTAEEQVDFKASLPRGRLITPDEIADIVAFLASPYPAPLHGAVIDASMGLGVRPGVITERR